MAKLINLTPHDINLLLPGYRRKKSYGNFITIKSTGIVYVHNARRKIPFTINGLPVFYRTNSVLEGLPNPRPGTYFIVSRTAAEVAWSKGRGDVLAMSGQQRNSNGRVYGCKSFDMIPNKIKKDKE